MFAQFGREETMRLTDELQYLHREKESIEDGAKLHYNIFV